MVFATSMSPMSCLRPLRWVVLTLLLALEPAFAERPNPTDEQLAFYTKVLGKDLDPDEKKLVHKYHESDEAETARPGDIAQSDKVERHKFFPWSKYDMEQVQYKPGDDLTLPIDIESTNPGLQYTNMDALVADMKPKMAAWGAQVESSLEDKAKAAVAHAQVVDALAEQEVNTMNAMTEERVSLNNQARDEKIAEARRLMNYMERANWKFKEIKEAAIKHAPITDATGDADTTETAGVVQKMLDLRFPANRNIGPIS